MVTSRFTLAAALVVLAQLIVPTGAAAQASREGPSFAAAGNWGTVRLPDVAFDTANGVYLTVSGNLTKGRFVRQDGAPLGAQFDVPTVGSHNQTARAAYSPTGRFLVVWYDTRVNPNAYQVWGRLVRYAAGGAPLFGRDFFIGAPAGGGNAELGIDVATPSGRGASSSPTTRSRRSTTSSPSSSISTARWSAGRCRVAADNHWQREPSVAYNPNTDSFLVAYGHYYNPAGPGAVHVRTVAAATGALGPVREIATGTAVYVPQVEFNPARGQFFVAWYTQPNIYGRPVAADGTPLGSTTLLAFNYPSYDALGLAYNPAADTYFIVFHGRGREDAGAQISAGGVPDVEFT